jgi:hypothetical protein
MNALESLFSDIFDDVENDRLDIIPEVVHPASPIKSPPKKQKTKQVIFPIMN